MMLADSSDVVAGLKLYKPVWTHDALHTFFELFDWIVKRLQLVRALILYLA